MQNAQRIEALAETCQTPFYLFDEDEVVRRIDRIRGAMPQGTRICYAMKANTFITDAASAAADLVEVCSPGELAICREIGIPDEKLVISGVYKEQSVMESLIASRSPIHRYTVESVAQFALLDSLASKAGVVIPVLMRLTSGAQFGMDVSDLMRLVDEGCEGCSLDVRGIQFFSGTQKASAKRVRRELEMLDDLVWDLEVNGGVVIEEIEYGPGVPVDYCEECAKDAGEADRAYLAGLAEALDDMRFSGSKILEIGRGIAASCGTYVTRVVDVKRNKGCNYAIVDGGKHQLVYYGQALALRPPACWTFPRHDAARQDAWAICGALCTTGDLLVKRIELPGLRIGDYVAFPNAGAYCMTEGLALFLSRDLPRVYLRKGDEAPRLVRDRFETSVLNTPQQ